MGHITRDTPWFSIDVDTDSGQIFVSQRWAYTWLLDTGQPAWTLAEKRNFHRRSDLAVWEVWSNRVRMRVSGASDFARRFAAGLVPVNHDIDWVLSGEHWDVHVKKVPVSQFHQSEVLWNQRIVRLGSNDFQFTNLGRGVHRRRYSVVAHEHGHSAGNTGVLRRGDEYPKPGRPPSPHVNNRRSVMHTGDQLHARHFVTLIEHLNQMIPDTRFSVGAIK